MTKRQLLLAFVFATSLAAQTASRDMCAPPPGSVPPSLPAKLLSGQGPIDFPITTKSAEAQKFFNQGVAQMHSFWATEAERSFLQAAALDPEAPMPQWGIAMVAAGDYRDEDDVYAYPGELTDLGDDVRALVEASRCAVDAASNAEDWTLELAIWAD